MHWSYHSLVLSHRYINVNMKSLLPSMGRPSNPEIMLRAETGSGPESPRGVLASDTGSDSPIRTRQRWAIGLMWHVHLSQKTNEVFNPLHATFFSGNKNIYLHFMSFLHMDMTQVVEILPQVRQGPTHSAKSISWLLMSWRRKEPGHQQPWYQLN